MSDTGATESEVNIFSRIRLQCKTRPGVPDAPILQFLLPAPGLELLTVFKLAHLLHVIDWRKPEEAIRNAIRQYNRPGAKAIRQHHDADLLTWEQCHVRREAIYKTSMLDREMPAIPRQVPTESVGTLASIRYWSDQFVNLRFGENPTVVVKTAI